MSTDPITSPSALRMSIPFAWAGKMTWATPVIARV